MLPDGPRTPPGLQLLQWITDPLKFMETSQARYGDSFTARLSSPLVFLSHPQAIQQIFTAPPQQFDSGRANEILQPWVGDQSLLLLDGDRHQSQRRLLTPPFHGDRMRAYGKVICDITEKVTGQWHLGEPVAVRGSMQAIALAVILQTVFGLHEGQRYDQLKQLVSSLLEVTGSPLRSSFLFFKSLQRDLGPWSPGGYFLRQKQQIDQLLYAEIQERRTELHTHSLQPRTDILSLLMAARDEHGQPMTDVELRDELITLLVAGHETTASALTWALYWVHHLPAVRDRLLQELDTVGDREDLSAVTKLPYLSAVCQETLRIYPIAMLTFPRIANSPVEIMDHKFDSGTSLSPCIYLLHHRPDLYPNPKQFLPERFLERQFSPYEYIPFGGSNRRCIGMAFALFEMKLVLATVLSRWQLTLANNRPVRPVRRGVTLAPSGGKWLVATGQRQKAVPVLL